MKTAKEVEHLRGPILRAVSRSFYLSLRALPRALRDPLSLAYLLARATDTIADTPGVAAKMRTDALRNLVDGIQGKAETAETVRDSFAPLQSNAAERALIELLPAALAWLDSLEERDRSEVRAVLQKINRGQTLDLERFSGAEMQALPTAADLDEYTYLVAGCVGGFWTRLCFAHVKNFSDQPEAEMRELGVQYGQGLQLINILRDAGADLREGRCYLPEGELHSLGLKPEEILRNPAAAEPVVRPWLEKAERGLAAGIEYACAIRPRRIRFATALPALIGARTLTLLREAGSEVFERKIKVSRAEVRKIISSTALTLASRRSLRNAYRK